MLVRPTLWVMCFCLFIIIFGTAARAAGVAPGTRDYNYTTHEMQYYSGTAWYGFALTLTLTLNSCTSEGTMDFNNTLALYQFCNGTRWVKIVGVPTLNACTQKGAMEFTAPNYFVCNGSVWTNITGNIIAS